MNRWVWMEWLMTDQELDAGTQDHWRVGLGFNLRSEWHPSTVSSSSSSRGQMPCVLKSDWGTQTTPRPYRRQLDWSSEEPEEMRARPAGYLNQDPEQKEVELSTSGWWRRCSCWYPGSDPCVMEEALFLSRWNWSPLKALNCLSGSAALGASFVRPTIRKQRWRWGVSHSMELNPCLGSHGPRAQNTQNWWREWLEYICLHQGFLPGLRRLSIVQWEDVVQ